MKSESVDTLVASTPARDALASMRDAGQAAAIVVERGRPVGIVTLDGLSEYLTAERCEATVSDAMDYVAVHIEPRMGVEDTMRAFRVAAWHSLDRRHPFAPSKQTDG